MCIVEECFLNFLQRDEFFPEALAPSEAAIMMVALTIPTLFPNFLAILHRILVHSTLVWVLVFLCGIFGDSFDFVWAVSGSGLLLFWVMCSSLSDAGVGSESAESGLFLNSQSRPLTLSAFECVLSSWSLASVRS